MGVDAAGPLLDGDQDRSPVEKEGPGVARRRLRGRIMLGLGVVLLAVVAWVGYKAYLAYHHLTAAKNLVTSMQEEFDRDGLSGSATLVRLAGQLRDEAGAAHSAVNDPLYRMATVVPWLGDNLEAVGQISRAMDDVATPLPDAAGLAASLGGGQLLKNGTVDIATVERATSMLGTLDSAVARAQAVTGSVDRAHLVGAVSDALSTFQAKLPKLRELSRTGVQFGHLAAPMLGAEGPRTYVLVFQNLSEPRATGGIFGSYVAVSVDRGRISIGEQGASSRDLPEFDPPIEKVDAATSSLYSDLIARYPNDVNFTPDFPSAAATFAKMYSAGTGQRVDGVIAIDPVVAAALLHGQTPITLPDGKKLTSANAVKVLLSDVYREFPTGKDVAARDAYLRAATTAVFGSLTTGHRDLIATVRTVDKMVEQRRVLIWSARPSEQDELVKSDVGGRLPTDTVGASTVGVFINDGSGSKLSYYLNGQISLVAGSCLPDKTRSARLSATFSYDAPSKGLSPYVLGYTAFGTPYQLRTNVLLFAPTGGSVGNVLVNGKAVPTLNGTDHGRQVVVVTIELMPGEKATVDAAIVVPDPHDGTTKVVPRLVTTPGPRAWENRSASYAACGPPANG